MVTMYAATSSWHYGMVLVPLSVFGATVLPFNNPIPQYVCH